MLKAQYARRGPVPQDVIETVPLSLPALASDKVRVKVLAAPINPSDILTLTGEYGMLPELPADGGNEGVGRIVALGSQVANVKEGQMVLLPPGCGSWAHQLDLPAKSLIGLPEGDPLQLAMLTVNPPTAALLLSEFVTLEKGDWVIQNAANSGVGGYLVQLARLRGLRTVNLVRREAAIAGVLEQGADVVLVDGPDIAERVRQATGGASIRLAIDAIGGAATDRLGACLSEAGCVVNYGMMSGEPCQLSPSAIVFRDISLRGFWLAKWFRTATPQRRAELFAELTGLIASGKLHARIAATFDLSEIKQAVAAAAAGERDGKILVVPR